MGLFTWVDRDCACGEGTIEFQSKACQEFESGRHHLDHVPVEVAKDINGQEVRCYYCGRAYKVIVRGPNLSTIPMEIVEL